MHFKDINLKQSKLKVTENYVPTPFSGLKRVYFPKIDSLLPIKNEKSNAARINNI